MFYQFLSPNKVILSGFGANQRRACEQRVLNGRGRNRTLVLVAFRQATRPNRPVYPGSTAGTGYNEWAGKTLYLDAGAGVAPTTNGL